MSLERGQYSFLPNPEPPLDLNSGGGRNGGGRRRRFTPKVSQERRDNVIPLDLYRTKQ